ncbi:MAG TPA: ABC transporter ATP-binding protein [Acidimicrobiales bacterium]|nr:ABC transporter ATP-binding protein [Acidimicrobiales bacterium]
MTAILDVEGVSVNLSGRRVLDDVTVRIGEGEFTALIGSNGAGKTTLLRVMLGLLPAQQGRVLVGGRPLDRRSPKVGYVPQKISLDPEMPMRARDLVALGVDGHRLGFPLPGRSHRSADRQARVEEALDAVGATAFADHRVGRLSGGEQQRVMIAHALVGRPRLLLLDEPLANLDIASTDEVVGVLSQVCRDRGVSVLISAHDMNPLLPFMDRIVYMAAGRVASGRTDEVVRTEVLTRLYGNPVEVVRVGNRVLVLGGSSDVHCP